MPIEHTYATKDGLKTRVISKGQAIRYKCLDCSNYQYSEVENCPILHCPLYPFRFGKDPGSTRGQNMTDEQREKISQRVKKMHKRRKQNELSEQELPKAKRSKLPK